MSRDAARAWLLELVAAYSRSPNGRLRIEAAAWLELLRRRSS
jgi:hypothetical protein